MSDRPRPVVRRVIPGVIRPVAVMVLVLSLAVAVGACSSDDADDAEGDRPSTTTSPPSTGPTTTAPLLGPPAPTFEALSDAFAYGDDPALDQLWDACAAGSGKACDDLYFAAPTDSEYEAFGYTCGNRPNLIICTELDEEPGLTPTTG